MAQRPAAAAAAWRAASDPGGATSEYIAHYCIKL